MRSTRRISSAGLVACLAIFPGTLNPQPAVATTLMTKALADIPGKEVQMLSVHYAAGGSDSVHRHNAQTFVYVLEGSIVMQVKGGRLVTLRPGDTFYEGIDDVHVVSRNASNTIPARFLVFFVKNTGGPALVPGPEGSESASRRPQPDMKDGRLP